MTPQLREETVNAVVDTTKLVRLEDAKSLFERAEADKQRVNATRRGAPYITLEAGWSYFRQAKTLKDDEYAKVPVIINGVDAQAEVVFVKKEGVTKGYLFVTEVRELTRDSRIVDADFYLFTLKGLFISAYRMKEGVIRCELVPRNKGKYRLTTDSQAMRTSRGFGNDFSYLSMVPSCNTENEGNDEDCGDYNGGGGKPIPLEEVTVYGTRKKKKEESYSPYPTYTPYIPKNNGFPDPEKLVRKSPRGGGGGGRVSHKENGSSNLAYDMIDADGNKVEDFIVDNLTNPCAKALLAQAPNLNNDIARLMRNTFGTSDKFNITVTEKPLSGMSGYSSFPEVKQNSIEAIIYLNSNMLGTVTQEYVLVTIYHEVIHVFLNAEHAKLGETVFNQKYPSVTYQDYPVGNGQQTRRYKLRTDHSRFDAFLEKLAQSIISFNPNFTLERARAIAKEGIVEDFFISPTDATFIQEQKNGTNGTKCP